MFGLSVPIMNFPSLVFLWINIHKIFTGYCHFTCFLNAGNLLCGNVHYFSPCLTPALYLTLKQSVSHICFGKNMSSVLLLFHFYFVFFCFKLQNFDQNYSLYTMQVYISMIEGVLCSGGITPLIL